MAVICPQCSLENPENSAFCRRCGTPLTQIADTSTGGPMQFYVPPNEQVAQQHFPPMPPLETSARLPFEQMPPQNAYTPMQTTPPPPRPAIPLLTQLGKRAFAGYGMPVSRASWLIADSQGQAKDLFAATREDLEQRGLPGVSISSMRLAERGFLVENREYLTAHRGSATIFVYITPAGRDLYIARTTTAQTPISLVRVALLVLFIILMIIGLAQSGLPPALTGSFSLGVAISTILITLSFPLLLLFLVLIVASLLAWLIHGDAGMYLRPAILNDFQVDDVAILGEVIDTSLRQAAQTVGMDAGEITTSSLESRMSRRIRFI